MGIVYHRHHPSPVNGQRKVITIGWTQIGITTLIEVSVDVTQITRQLTESRTIDISGITEPCLYLAYWERQHGRGEEIVIGADCITINRTIVSTINMLVAQA